MKVSFQRLEIWLVAFFAITNAPIGEASQSSIFQRGGFNTSRQQSFITALNCGLSDNTFASASFAYTRTPIDSLIDTDTFYQGTLGLGYALTNLAFDFGFTISRSPLSGIHSVGGSFGMTYIYIPGGANAADYEEHALSALHSQIYEQKQENPPLFWVRFGYTGNSMSSTLLADLNHGKETALSVDAFYPYSNELLFSLGVAFHGYDDSKGFYDRVFENANNAQLDLLASTVHGLPHSSVSTQVTYQLATRDAAVPRYTGTEIDSSRTWVHTFDLGWRHQFSKHWYMTPTYEISVQETTPASAITVDLLYLL